MKRGRASILLIAVLAACNGTSLFATGAPADCDFPAGTNVTVVGETPLARLGLNDPGLEPGPPGGTVLVTTEPISRFTGEPALQMWCVIYGPEHGERVGDGSTLSGASGPVPEGWTPPEQ
jgi:hypothetical protein